MLTGKVLLAHHGFMLQIAAAVTQDMCVSFNTESMVNMKLLHMTVDMTSKGEYILISNCTFKHLSPQIFDPKLEMIPQTKQFDRLHTPMLCIIFLNPQRAPFIFAQLDGELSQGKILLEVTTCHKDVLKSYLHHHQLSNRHA